MHLRVIVFTLIATAALLSPVAHAQLTLPLVTNTSLSNIAALLNENPNYLIDFDASTRERQSYSGWYNNIGVPSLGIVDQPLERVAKAAYDDGVYIPSGRGRPNPRLISEEVMKGASGLGSWRNRTALMVFFGQLTVMELVTVQPPVCPTEYFNVQVPLCDQPFDHDCTGEKWMPIHRSRFAAQSGQGPNNPREQLNTLTPYIDGGVIYGDRRAVSDAIRSFSNGELLTQDINGEEYPSYNTIGIGMENPAPPTVNRQISPARFFRTGNAAQNENPMLLSVELLLYREHNYQARRLRNIHPDWSDEDLYQRARQWTIAHQQRITAYEWVPAFTNQDLPAYMGYHPTTSPGISQPFHVAAMRFGHTVVPPGGYRRNNQCVFHTTTNATGDAGNIAFRTCNSFFTPNEAVLEHGLADMLMGLSSQICEREDRIIVEDLRNFVQGPLDQSRRDLMVLNIQRGRDHGVPDYQTIREAFGLPRKANFSEIPSPDVPNNGAWEALERAYNGSLDNIDVWAGGIVETGMDPGELFTTIIIDQFSRIRDADRWWFENTKNSLFSAEEIAIIHNTTIADLIRRNTAIAHDDIQDDVFHHVNGDPCPQPKQLEVSDMEECTELHEFDFYNDTEGREETAWALGAIGVWILFNALGMYLAATWRRHKWGFFGVFHNPFWSSWWTRVDPALIPTGACIDGVSAPDVLTIDNLTLHGAIDLSSRDAQPTACYVAISDGTTGVLLFDATSLTLMRKIHPTQREYPVQVYACGDERVNTCGVLFLDPMHHSTHIMFGAVSRRDAFLEQLRAAEHSYATGCLLIDTNKPLSDRQVQKRLVAREDRQAEVRRFLRVAMSQPFSRVTTDTPDIEIHRIVESLGPTTGALLHKTLTRAEFCFAFDLPPDGAFAKQVCDMLVGPGRDHVPFRAVLDMLTTMSRGTPEQKMNFLFGVYDVNGDGTIDFETFKMMLRANLEASGVELLSSDHVDELAKRLYMRAGIIAGQDMTLAAFERLLGVEHTVLLDDMQFNPAMSSMNNNFDMKPTRAGGRSPFHRIKVALGSSTGPTPSSDGNGDGAELVDGEARPVSAIGVASRRTSVVSVHPNRHLPGRNPTLLRGSVSVPQPGRQSTSVSSAAAVIAAQAQAQAEFEAAQARAVASRASQQRPKSRAVIDLLEGRSQLNASNESVNAHDGPPSSDHMGAMSNSNMLGIDRPLTKSAKEPPSVAHLNAVPLAVSTRWTRMRAWLRDNRLSVFWLSLYTIAVILIFVERFHYYGYLRESRGLRRITGFGVATTRGSASVIMFTLSVLLLAVSRNTITLLRSTPVRHLLPLDEAISFHSIVGWTFVGAALVHTAGHCVNFYSIVTQPSEDLTCLLPAVFHYSSETPGYTYWLFQTMTGITGYTLVFVVVTFVAFLTPYMRRHAYDFFTLTHRYLSPLIYILTVLHGSLQLVQAPYFQFFLAPSIFVYVLDKLYTLSRRHRALRVIEVRHLPSGVISLVFERPASFVYQPGMWVRVATAGISRGEFHPFTLTSAPHEDHLQMHIRQVGRWTRRLAQVYPDTRTAHHSATEAKTDQIVQALPPLYIEGPFGESAQEWYRYETAVLIGGGIGVTPYASILKDLVQRARRSVVQHVYFLWVCRSQKKFEWFIDVIREAEEEDKDGILEAHVFITQAKQKFDLRTLMLYVAERSSSETQGERSVLTGTRAVTHFGRPDFVSVLQQVQLLHPNQKIGVFSTGPPRMVASVDSAVGALNTSFDDSHFVHFTGFVAV